MWRTFTTSCAVARAPLYLAVLALIAAGGASSNASATTTTTYYYTDAQGSVLMTTDASGSPSANSDHKPYGATALGESGNGPGFTGHVEDPESLLVYMQARYYDPDVGRFLSVDPDALAAGDVATFNRYAYVNDNPATRTDPSGRRSVYDAGGGPMNDMLPWSRDRYGPSGPGGADSCSVCVDKGADDKKSSKDNSSSALSYAEIADIVKANNRSGQSDEIVIAVAWKESNFDPKKKSSTSTATGLMQMTKGATKEVGYKQSEMTDPAKNIQAGTTYLRSRIAQRGGDLVSGLNGYGTGRGYADNIIQAAAALRQHPEDSSAILSQIHD